MSNSVSAVEMLAKLVGFDTVSSKSNMQLIEFVKAYLADHGVQATVIPNEDGTKANLWATIGPPESGGVALSGHTDVVPVDGQPWDTDPFTLVEKDNRYYGRGTCDMKAFPATAMALLPEMLAKPLRRPIHFAFSYDEEIGCYGAARMIPEITKNLPRPSVVIVGEPTSMKVVSAHKGMWDFDVSVTGKEAHSSLPHHGVSAVMTGARLIAKLDEMAKARAAAADPACPFDPPYSSIHVGTAAGGTAANIVSRRFDFHVDIRHLPDEFPKDIQDEFVAWYESEILPEMHAVDPGTGIEISEPHSVPGLKQDTDSEAEQFVRQITGDNGVHVVSYGTEAGQFQNAGMASVVCGPGSIEQAHQPNEYVEKDQVQACENFLRKVIERCRA
ncbi:MAG: acetylornithine deacetylase [Alphaproteobacteria bacterium]